MNLMSFKTLLPTFYIGRCKISEVRIPKRV